MGQILTSSEYDRLSDEAQARSDVDQLVQSAEWRTVDKYREELLSDPLTFDDIGGVESVRLTEWAEDSNGDPDTAAMPDELVSRLRTVIASIVDHWVQQDGISDLKRERHGDSRLEYRDLPHVPAHLFAPLRPYDERRLRL